MVLKVGMGDLGVRSRAEEEELVGRRCDSGECREWWTGRSGALLMGEDRRLRRKGVNYSYRPES